MKPKNLKTIQQLENAHSRAAVALVDHRWKSGFVPGTKVLVRLHDRAELRGVIAPYGVGDDEVNIPVLMDGGRGGMVPWPMSKLRLDPDLKEPKPEEPKAMKQEWNCERCGSNGVVEFKPDAGCYEAVMAIQSAHSAKAPTCSDHSKIRAPLEVFAASAKGEQPA